MSETLPHLSESLDYQALDETPRDVLRRAEHELAHAIQIRMWTHPEEDQSRDLERLALVRDELARRDGPLNRLAMLLHLGIAHVVTS